MNDFIELAKARDRRTVWVEIYDHHDRNSLERNPIERTLLPKDLLGPYMKLRFPEGCDLDTYTLTPIDFLRLESSVRRTYENGTGLTNHSLDERIRTSLERYKLQRNRYYNGRQSHKLMKLEVK
mgnify:CR=1 FL=1